MMEKNDWFEMWKADRESMLSTMIRNMAADLDAGYDFHGECIQRQKKEIADFEHDYNVILDLISVMEPKKVQHFCYIQLLKHGAIS